MHLVERSIEGVTAVWPPDTYDVQAHLRKGHCVTPFSDTALTWHTATERVTHTVRVHDLRGRHKLFLHEIIKVALHFIADATLGHLDT